MLQAILVEVKLSTINCGLQHLTDWENYAFVFEPEEMKKLAQMEHDRYCEEKAHGG